MHATAVATSSGSDEAAVPSSSAALAAVRPLGGPTSPRHGGAAPLQTVASVRDIASSADTERKSRFIQRVPILKQLLRDQHCSEAELTSALRVASYVDGEYIYCQGQVERDMYFIEDGKVLITQRRLPTVLSAPGAAGGSLAPPASLGPTRQRSVQYAELEIQIETHHTNEYFGELALLQHKPARQSNAVASGAVACLVLVERDYEALLKPLHALLLYRHLLRAHGVLEKDRLFKEWSSSQRQHLIDRCQLESFGDGELICRQGETDDRYFVLADGEAEVVLEEAAGFGELDTAGDAHSLAPTSTLTPATAPMTTVSTVVARKSIFQGFGEMGLLDKPRTASVVAVGASVLCVVITRAHYIAAAQLGAHGVATAMDVDAEVLLATTLIEEWKLVINARNLHLSNPHVAHYLVTFIKQFKAAYNQKFAGKTLYLDFFRRLHQEPSLADEFTFVSSRVAWDSPASSLGIIRSETRRVLNKPPAQRSTDEMSFIGRLIESTGFIGKFDVPGPHIDRHKLARCLAKVVAFANISKDAYLFRQGKIESRAFLILRGKINIVNEDVSTISSAIKHHELIATLSAGDSFGELSLVTRLQRSATTMAACDSDLLVFDRDHLQHVQSVLPGVSVQQLMVKRAEFLARLSFFRGCDFGQCIRVAHDLQEVAYEARYLFMQEPAHQRTLYIVKSGEIAVLMKTRVPTASPDRNRRRAVVRKPQPLAKRALVRVATIGAQEFFGVAIATVNPGPLPSGATFSSPLPAAASGSGGQAGATAPCDLTSAVYVSTTRVVLLELSERGWRRLSPQSLVIVRNALLERHKWNESVASTENAPVAPIYFSVDKPWQQLPSQQQTDASAADASGASGGSSANVGRPNSQLARHLHEKQSRASPFTKLFVPTASSESESAKSSDSREGSKAGRCAATPPTTAWGWRSPFSGAAPSLPVSAVAAGKSTAVSHALSPLVSFGSPSSKQNTGMGSPLSGTRLLPSPPRDHRVLHSAAASQRPQNANALWIEPPQRLTLDAVGTTKSPEYAQTYMWKARTPASRRTEYSAP